MRAWEFASVRETMNLPTWLIALPGQATGRAVMAFHKCDAGNKTEVVYFIPDKGGIIWKDNYLNHRKVYKTERRR